MATTYEDAFGALYQAPHDAFVTERKRLAGELKAAGDATGAARLARLTRPPLSAWVVNQLYYHARSVFDALLETAERLREGDLAATGEHREALARLRGRAVKILEAAGHAATDATLRRVTTTLAALAAAGSFDPDPPGALSGDRDPPGFAGFSADPSPEPARPAAKQKTPARERTEAARERAEAAARAERERQREEQERERRKQERERLRSALRDAKETVRARTQAVNELQKKLSRAEEELEEARTSEKDAERRLAALEDKS